MLKVLIASHFNDVKRLDTICDLIRSIASNARKPDAIYLSCSFEEKLVEDKTSIELFEELNLKLQHLSKPISLMTNFEKTKTSQFHHYSKLLHCVNDDDIVMFADDDDLYDTEKIDQVYWFFFTYPDRFICQQYHGIFTFNGKYNCYYLSPNYLYKTNLNIESNIPMNDRDKFYEMKNAVETTLKSNPNVWEIQTEYFDFSIKGFKLKEAFNRDVIEDQLNGQQTVNIGFTDILFSVLFQEWTTPDDQIPSLAYYKRFDYQLKRGYR